MSDRIDEPQIKKQVSAQFSKPKKLEIKDSVNVLSTPPPDRLDRRGYLGKVVDKLEERKNFRKHPELLKSELNKYIKKHKLKTAVLRIEPKQTLQSISYKLYKTHWRWPELYVLNHKSMKSWNHIIAGRKLRYIEPNQTSE